MHGGWDTQHIHNQASVLSAPDKEQAEMQYNMLDEPVVVMSPEEDEALKKDRLMAENYINIHLKATLEQDAVVEVKQEPQVKQSLFKSIFNEVKAAANNILIEPHKYKYKNFVSLVNGPEFAEVYTEVTRTEGKKAHARVVWKLRNSNEHLKWSKDLQIVPCSSFPTLRIHWESDICQLEYLSNGELKLHVQIPEDFKSNHLILLLKMRQANGQYIGPNLLLFVKLINQKASGEEVSAFAQDNNSDDMNGRSSLDRSMDQIGRGIDVYSEQQLLHMGSILADEGYG